MKPLSQSFKVEYKYKVFFTESLFNEDNMALHTFMHGFEQGTSKKKILFVIDEKVLHCHPYLTRDIPNYFARTGYIQPVKNLLVLPGGEHAKNEEKHVSTIIDAIHTQGIDRHSIVAAIGGGALLDLAGYAAAISHRGIRHIRIPTTVLSQNDSGVGVKNGVNFKGKKNFIGTFSPPVAVFNDYRFLETLHERDWRSGMAEAVKVALVKDPAFFSWLEEHASELGRKNKAAMKYLVYRCAELHMQHISGNDPFEQGSSRPLDFGHWAAHKLEQLSGFSIRHGEAVAIGIAIDSIYSQKTGLLSTAELDRILALLLNLDFDLFHPALMQRERHAIMDGLNEFREHLGGRLTIMLLEAIGKGKEVHEMDTAIIKEAINTLHSSCLIHSPK
jgi:3-dehydroquinate synthase